MQARVSHVSTTTAATAATAAPGNAPASPTFVQRGRGGSMKVFPVIPASVPVPEEIQDERKPAAFPLPKCAICLSMNASIILIPCGHVCLCKDDAERLRRNQQLLHCPLCRNDVQSTNEVFFNH